MARTRTPKTQEPEVEVPKVSEDKVSKRARKEKKPKAAVKEASEGSESSTGGSKVTKDLKQEDGEKVEAKSVESSADSSSDSDSEASDSSTSDSEEAEAPTKAKQAPVEVEPNAIFTVDTKPAKTAPKPHEAKSENAEEKSKEDNTERASQVNRRARRRLQLIGKQREALRKSMNLKADENSHELEAALEKWIRDTDGKAEVRDTKKKARKEKDALRLRTRKGKLLKGRKLKERKKVLDKVARREANQEKRQAEQKQES